LDLFGFSVGLLVFLWFFLHLVLVADFVRVFFLFWLLLDKLFLLIFFCCLHVIHEKLSFLSEKLCTGLKLSLALFLLQFLLFICCLLFFSDFPGFFPLHEDFKSDQRTALVLTHQFMTLGVNFLLDWDLLDFDFTLSCFVLFKCISRRKTMLIFAGLPIGTAPFPPVFALLGSFQEKFTHNFRSGSFHHLQLFFAQNLVNFFF
jgi:hypothetical protein